MDVSVIGTGYVGLVTGALFADRGNKVICVDNQPEIVDSLRQGKIHIFEPGLEEIVLRTVQQGDLSFTTDLPAAVRASKIIFLAVVTPSNDGDGSFNLDYIQAAAGQVGQALRGTMDFKVVVTKSTVPPKTYETLT